MLSDDSTEEAKRRANFQGPWEFAAPRTRRHPHIENVVEDYDVDAPHKIRYHNGEDSADSSSSEDNKVLEHKSNSRRRAADHAGYQDDCKSGDDTERDFQ